MRGGRRGRGRRGRRRWLCGMYVLLTSLIALRQGTLNEPVTNDEDRNTCMPKCSAIKPRSRLLRKITWSTSTMYARWMLLLLCLQWVLRKMALRSGGDYREELESDEEK